jgi:glycosyltransferase involved in cell wall biosynthesis
MPNYPDGILPERYKGKFFVRDKLDGIDVCRSYVLPAANSRPGRRMVGFLTFLMSSLVNSFRLKGKFDLVIASSPPVTTAVAGYIISRLKRARFVLELRDLQPESGVQFGNLEESLFTRTLRVVMSFLYKRADRIVSATDGINEFLREYGISPRRVVTVKSGVGDDFIFGHSNGVRKKFGWKDKFLVTYSGTLGLVRPLETIIEAAKSLAHERDIHFVFVGDGQKKAELEKLTERYELDNVSFTGIQPLEDIPFFLRASDVLIECLKEVEIARMAVPSKVFEYMASGRPIVLGCPKGEASALLDSAGGALTYRSCNADELSELVLRLRSGKIDGPSLGQGYHKYIRENHSRHRWASRYLEVIDEL